MSQSLFPVANADVAASTAYDTPVTINVLASDSSNGGTLNLTGVTQGAHGTVTLNQGTAPAVQILQGQEIDAGAVLAYEWNQPWTVMTDLNVGANPQAAAVIASNLSGPQHQGYQIYINSAGQVEVRIVSNFSTGNYLDVCSSVTVTGGEWQNVAVTYDGSGSASGVKIYVDGVLDTATTTLVNNLSGSIVSQGPLIVGNQAGYESQFALNGSLADFSISDVARSASYIAQNASFFSAPPVDAATVLAYSFSAGSGTEVQDLSADSYNATLSSSAMWSRGPALPVSSLTYTPAPGFTGSDSFSYTESNGTTGQVDVTVTPVNTVSTAEGSAVSLNVLASNGAVGNLTLTGVTQGAHGTVTLQGTAPGVQILQGQEINAGAVLAYEWNQPWTVMTNLNVGANPQAAAVIASNLSGPARQGYQIYINSSGHIDVRLISNFAAGDYLQVRSSVVVTGGEWQNVAVTYDGSGSASGVKIYVDGVLDTATTTLVNNLSGSIVSQGPLIVGNQAGYESQFALNGSLADFSISDVARSASYIAQNASFSSAPPVDAATVLAYSFSAGSGTEVQDLSADSYNATLSSSAMWSRGPALPVNSLTYTPAPGFTGTDSFSYTESNGTTGQVDVTVTPVNTVSTAEGSAVSLNVLASNGAVGNLTLTGVTQGAHGTVTLNQGTAPAVQILQGQEINAGAVLAYEWNQPWTVMADINVASNPSVAAIIFTNVNASPYPGYELWIDSQGYLRVRIISNIYTENYIDVRSSVVVTGGEWQNVAVTYDGSGSASGVKIYVDGVLDTATTTLVNNLSGSIVSQGPLIVGNQAGYESQFALNGSLADFSISDVARSASYIAQNASFSSAPPVDAATVLAYSFSAGSGTEVQDLSADSYNATLSSSAMWSRGPALPASSLTYTPAPGFTGSDSFSYTESNGTTGQVDVTVTPAIPVDVSTAEGSAVSLNVLASNGAVGNLTLTGVTQGAHGTVTLNQGTAPAVKSCGAGDQCRRGTGL